MNRVICIDNIDYSNGRAFPSCGHDPEIGEICEVQYTCIGTGRNGYRVACYKLIGYDEHAYDQRNFAPLIGSDDLVEELKEEEEAMLLDEELKELIDAL